MNGFVIKIVDNKGFGFIQGDDGKEYFFHSSALLTANIMDLRINDRVSFRVTSSPKGPRAEDVETNSNG